MRYCLSLLVSVLPVLAGCSVTDPPDPTGAYSRDFWTPDSAGVRLITSNGCHRYLQRALVSLSGHWFDISINVFEDCRPPGDDYKSYEVLVVGTFEVRGDTIDFTSDLPETPPFLATFSRADLTLSVPAWADSLGSQPLVLVLPKLSDP